MLLSAISDLVTDATDADGSVSESHKVCFHMAMQEKHQMLDQMQLSFKYYLIVILDVLFGFISGILV